jgi:hypothetical protein
VHYTDVPKFGLSAFTDSGAIVANPALTEFGRCATLSATIKPGWNPFPKSQRNFNCKLGLSHNNNPYSPIGDGTLLDIGVWHIPGYQPQNWNEGVRLHTLVGPGRVDNLLLQRRGQ